MLLALGGNKKIPDRGSLQQGTSAESLSFFVTYDGNHCENVSSVAPCDCPRDQGTEVL